MSGLDVNELQMSPTLRLWSHSRSLFRGTVVRPLAVKHQQAIQNFPLSVLPSSLTSNIFCTSAILSVYKDQKPGRLRRHAESVNNKVGPMQGSYDIHYSQIYHWNDKCNDSSDNNDIIAPLDKMIMSFIGTTGRHNEKNWRKNDGCRQGSAWLRACL